jgi:hypothetical protein
MIPPPLRVVCFSLAVRTHPAPFRAYGIMNSLLLPPARRRSGAKQLVLRTFGVMMPRFLLWRASPGRSRVRTFSAPGGLWGSLPSCSSLVLVGKQGGSGAGSSSRRPGRESHRLGMLKVKDEQ